MIGNSGSDKHAELIGSLGQSGKQSPHSKTFKPSPNHKEIYKSFFVLQDTYWSFQCQKVEGNCLIEMEIKTKSCILIEVLSRSCWAK